jgi:hypothetical protein
VHLGTTARTFGCMVIQALPRRAGRRLAAVVAVSGILATAPGLPAAGAATSAGGTLAIAQLRPITGYEEAGIVHLAVRPRSSSILVDLGHGNDQLEYGVRLSRASCAAVRRDPSRPRFVGPVVVGFTGTTFDDEAAARVSSRSVRATRSIVLVGRGTGGKFEPRACGTALMVDIANLPGT